MNKFKRFEIWLALFLLAFLAVFSIVGAFIGVEKTTAIVNSNPMVFYWAFFVVLLLTGLATFRKLIEVPSSLLMHLGCIVILAGAMWGSKAGHELQKKIFGIEKIRSGYILIHKGACENKILTADSEPLGKLPFDVCLEDFRIDYYSGKSVLEIGSKTGQKWEIPSQAGAEIILDGKQKIQIIKIFKNFKIDIQDSKQNAYDEEGAGSNPAIQLEIKQPGGKTESQYVFENFPQENFDENGLKFTYHSQASGAVRDYFSDLKIVREGKTILTKTIEVNKPLHFGGYHFYQHSYDFEKNEYTILSVVSDSGINAIYAGYIFLMLGAVWHFWLTPAAKYFKRRENGN